MDNKLDVYMMGVEGDTYKKLLDIAKKENKAVNEVAADALKKHIDDNDSLKESVSQKKLLMEG